MIDQLTVSLLTIWVILKPSSLTNESFSLNSYRYQYIKRRSLCIE